MPRSPSIVPEESDRDIYIVLDDFGPLGRAWRETDDAQADRATLVRDLLDGQYDRSGADSRVQHRARLVARCHGRYSQRTSQAL